MNGEGKKNRIKKIAGLLIYVLSMVGAYFATYLYLGPKVEDIISQGDINFVSRLSGKQTAKNKELFEDRGLRTANFQNGYETIPTDIISEVTHRDVRLISTKRRPFTQQEITLLKLIIDMVPQKLFDYRPWAIISTRFDTEEFLTHINPDGVAFTSGPYIFVSDVTFTKQNSYDTGTFRGLMRVMSHEFMHVAQFFDTKKFPESFVHTYLESADITQDWIKTQGWTLEGKHWVLDKDQITSDYGRSSPVEDMADAVGAMVIGDEYILSQSRADWVMKWLGISRETLYMGTIPLSPTLKQRKTETSDIRYITKYYDETALIQDIMHFQSTKTISIKDQSEYYAKEFEKRGWSGTINSSGIGELTYFDRIKINLEIDKNPLRVTTMVMTVY